MTLQLPDWNLESFSVEPAGLFCSHVTSAVTLQLPDWNLESFRVEPAGPTCSRVTSAVTLQLPDWNLESFSFEPAGLILQSGHKCCDTAATQLEP